MRRKTTIYLLPIDLERVEFVKCKWGERTTAKAIRQALKVASADPPDTTAIAAKVLKWAETLPFRSKRENKELREFTRELYHLMTRRGECP